MGCCSLEQQWLQLQEHGKVWHHPGGHVCALGHVRRGLPPAGGEPELPLPHLPNDQVPCEGQFGAAEVQLARR